MYQCLYRNRASIAYILKKIVQKKIAHIIGITMSETTRNFQSYKPMNICNFQDLQLK